MADVLQPQFVEIGIAGERYAFPIEDIREIIKIQQITEIPNSKPYLLGVFNLRGTVAPVVSLRKRFGLPEIPFTPSSRIVIVSDKEALVGLVVDQVHQVISFPDIQPPPEKTGGREKRYVVGIGKNGSELVGLLKLERILYDDTNYG
ncbi:chemotaxis protein CheW [Paenibacillus ginsengarvi]|uniref:Purine-binding chemotaxis protein CheW n=1 Tax=Paenibacillus ginsengarvi TaxID=400777 RepID=A0A3B0CBM6_9BACL|nr:chemotaxis protein CheW [Paenibacillus ginsengarvi]RKN82018.1 purine-binding chemotaxis protein CheW [Paenibacillus ginsengarvi]